MFRGLRAVSLALVVGASPAVAQDTASRASLEPLWRATVALAPVRVEISAWRFGVMVQTLDVDPGIATIEDDSVVAAWVTTGFDFFDAIGAGSPPPAFGWSQPANEAKGIPAEGLRLGLVPDPARRGALTLALVISRHAPRRGYVVPVSEAEGSRLLGLIGEAAGRVRGHRDALPPGPACREPALLATRGPQYPKELVREGRGGEVWAAVDVDSAGYQKPGASSILWASEPEFRRTMLQWLPQARWATKSGGPVCAGPALVPIVYAMERKIDQDADGWIWIRRTP